MEGDRREPPPVGGTNGSNVSGGDCCRYVITYHTRTGDEEPWVLDWSLSWLADPEVRWIDTEQVDGPAPNRVIVELSGSPEDCRTSSLRRSLVGRLAERVDTFSLTCQPVPEARLTARPASVTADRRPEVSG